MAYKDYLQTQDSSLTSLQSGGLPTYGPTAPPQDPALTSLQSAGLPTYGPNTTISSATIAPTTNNLANQYVSPTQTPIYPIGGLNTNPTEGQKLSPEDEAVQRRIDEQIKLNDEAAGEQAYQAQQEQQYGIQELKNTQTDLTSQLRAIQNEALAIPISLKQRGIEQGIALPIIGRQTNEELSRNAIKALTVNSLLEASRGNLLVANDMVDRVVQAKYGSIKATIEANLKNLDLILKSPSYTNAERERAQAQKDIQEQKAKVVAKQEADTKEIGTIVNTAIKYGLADPVVMRRISEANSPLEALQIAAPYLQDPQAKYELEQSRLDNILKQKEISYKDEQIRTEIVERGQIGKPTPSEQKAINEALETAKTAVPILDDKIFLIDSLLTHSGLNSAVGPNAAARFAIADAFGAKQDFIAGVQQLVNKETIDTLINLKARGGTLGALSDQERILLQSAATRIGSWQVEKNGKVDGYAIDEASFKKELETIKRLATLAREKATGGIVSLDEKSILDSMFNVTSTLSGFNPSSYFK